MEYALESNVLLYCNACWVHNKVLAHKDIFALSHLQLENTVLTQLTYYFHIETRVSITTV